MRKLMYYPLVGFNRDHWPNFRGGAEKAKTITTSFTFGSHPDKGTKIELYEKESHTDGLCGSNS